MYLRNKFFRKEYEHCSKRNQCQESGYSDRNITHASSQNWFLKNYVRRKERLHQCTAYEAAIPIARLALARAVRISIPYGGICDYCSTGL